MIRMHTADFVTPARPATDPIAAAYRAFAPRHLSTEPPTTWQTDAEEHIEGCNECVAAMRAGRNLTFGRHIDIQANLAAERAAREETK